MTHTDVFRSSESNIQPNSRWRTPLVERIELRRKLFDNGYDPIPTLGKATYIRYRGCVCSDRYIFRATA